MTPPTNADVLARRRELILGGDADGFADLFARDAVIEFPHAGPPGKPLRLVGRQAIREYARQVMAMPLQLDTFEVAALYQTMDPEVMVVEMRTEGSVTTSGRRFAATSVQILRVHGGQIVLFRDFPDPRGVEDVLGPALADPAQPSD
jgi:ketosteroid isomerase-like protein